MYFIKVWDVRAMHDYMLLHCCSVLPLLLGPAQLYLAEWNGKKGGSLRQKKKKLFVLKLT